MATQNEALDLKRRARRRLVGAIALVLFLVIVPPLVMDLEPKPVTTTLNVEIPNQDGRRVLPPPPAPAAELQPEPPEQPAVATEQASPPTSPAFEAPVAPPTSAIKSEENKAGEAQSAYMIPLATLSKKDNVKQLQAKVNKAGIKTFTEPVKTASGEQTRVRAGPFATKEAAEKARVKLQQLGVNPGTVALR